MPGRWELGGGGSTQIFLGQGQPFLGVDSCLCVKNNNDDYCFLLWVNEG